MESITIKKIGVNEIESLQKISKQTFIEAFSEENNEEDMSAYLEESLSMIKLREELTNPESQFYFATLDNQLIGYLKLNFGSAQTELKEEYGVELERIYVLKEFYGKKAGQILYAKALEIAQARNAQYLWLGVWEKNLRAIRFYQKNGFVEFDKHFFRLGKDVQTDIMMKVKLAKPEH